ncbi:probable E3 ubiquitin-protein ligase BAH1-like 2 isoform X3 [Cornus florida]|uniref:probable E3 ubiquitin-protein ligase BAH1-like 2 isoform X3 n=1 Tax=Cornus florida TaxID=4283 RepID=UPI00289D059E|nr:probable E3 ubiquitin-protein ligase BAH1-like 2 isoform X3 [Cornus florida]
MGSPMTSPPVQTLLKEMSAVIRCFKERVKKLIERHHSSGFHKYFIRLKDKLQGNQIDLIQEGKDLITYALINTMAMRKLLKKYDEIHFSKQGQAFKSQAQSRHIEILQSPWLYELMAFHVNLRKAPVLFDGCSVICKPSLSCDLFDSVKLAIDLTCPICLDTVFDAVCLTCGHIFCHMCACKAASVTIVDGMKAADPKEKCPLCREEGVYEGAVHLEELNILLSSSCPEYWDERLQMERVDRVQQAKEHWESQCRAFMGV